MKLLLSVFVGSAIMATAGAALAGPALASPPTPVGAHRHYIIAGDGSKVYVGPNFCGIDAAETGFAAYHYQVHLTDPGVVDAKAEGC